MRLFQVKLTEKEMKVLIFHHTSTVTDAIASNDKVDHDTVQRIADLSKRLAKETPEIERSEIETVQTAPAGWNS